MAGRLDDLATNLTTEEAILAFKDALTAVDGNMRTDIVPTIAKRLRSYACIYNLERLVKTGSLKPSFLQWIRESDETEPTNRASQDNSSIDTDLSTKMSFASSQSDFASVSLWLE